MASTYSLAFLFVFVLSFNNVLYFFPENLEAFFFEKVCLDTSEQGLPLPLTIVHLSGRSVRNWATQQVVSSGQESETSSVFKAAPHCLHNHLNSGKQVQGPHWLCIMVNCVHYISQQNNSRSKVHNKCNVFESSPNKSPHLSHGKIFFHKTAPWCQKFWGLLM